MLLSAYLPTPLILYHGMIILMPLPSKASLFLPLYRALEVRLLSPQRYMKHAKGGALLQTPGYTTFYFNKTSPLTFHALNDGRVGLPIASLHRRRRATWFDEALLQANVLNPDNANLSHA